jgi:hypothetical protein
MGGLEMTWLKLDDQFHRHEKIAPLSDRAFRLHVTVLLECSAKLTDGKLPERLLQFLPRAPRGKTLSRVVDELLGSGVWERIGTDIVVHDFLDWNPSAAKVSELREKRSAAGRSGGKRSASKRQANAKQLLEQTGSKPEAKPNPVPVPVPTTSKEAVVVATTADSSGRPIPRKPVFPEMVKRETYQPSDRMVSWAQGLGLGSGELDSVMRDLLDKHGLRPHTLDWWDVRWMRFAETVAQQKTGKTGETMTIPSGIEVS